MLAHMLKVDLIPFNFMNNEMDFDVHRNEWIIFRYNTAVPISRASEMRTVFHIFDWLFFSLRFAVDFQTNPTDISCKK